MRRYSLYKNIHPTSIEVCDLNSKKQTGFTLIEVMIVVAIVAIISAIAYPSYLEHVRKTRRADAQIKLQELAQLQESHFARNFTYAQNLSGLLGGGSSNTISSDEGFYSLSVSSANGGGGDCSGTRASPCTAYTLQAVPQLNSSQAKDTHCSRYTLDNLGRRAANAATATEDTTAQCW